jgi:TRAP transporter TAXI family solute receptor
MRRFALLVSGALVLSAGTAAEAADLKLMTGPQGGSWYPLGGALKTIFEAAVPGTTVHVMPGGGIANVKALQAGKAEIAFANSVSTVDAVEGKPPFEEKATNVCHMATLYPQYFQVIVLADAGIESPKDLRGKALTTQPKGNTGEAITEHLLAAYGLSYNDLSQVSYGSYTDSVNLMKDGNAQVFTLGTTVPAGAVMDLAAARAIRLLPIDDEGLARMQELNPGYRRIVIEAGTYPGQDRDVPTIGYATHLIARCDLDADLVHSLLAAMADKLADLAAVTKAMEGLDVKGMASDVGVPLHEGAKRFYQEKGVL